jgi:hypothetical protein
MSIWKLTLASGSDTSLARGQRKSTTSSDQLVNSENLSDDADSLSFLGSIEQLTDMRHSHCTSCQCLLTAFDDESIYSAAELLMDIRNLYYMKTKDEVHNIQYRIWSDTAQLGESVSAACDETTTFCDES